jgi:hypothetical protein
MKKLILLLFIPFVCFSQEDIERYKVYNTTNIYTSLLLDSATGRIWQLQIGVGDTDRLKTVLSDREFAQSIESITKDWKEGYDESLNNWEEEYNSKPDSIVSAEKKKYYKPYDLKETIEGRAIAKNGRFKLYPTDNSYNFIMVDVINGFTYQVQWSTKSDERFVQWFW